MNAKKPPSRAGRKRTALKQDSPGSKFAEWLYLQRMANGITSRKELAKRVRLTASKIRQAEKGKASLNAAVQLARFFGADFLFHSTVNRID